VILLALALLSGCDSWAEVGWEPSEPACRAYDSDRDEPGPVQAVTAGLPAGASELSWVAPTSPGVATSGVYRAPFSAATATASAHTGLDMVNNNPAVPTVPVVAAAEGQVVFVRDGCPQSATFTPNQERRDCGGGLGNQVVIDHGGGLYTRYAHLEPGVPVAAGAAVMAGDLIGAMGTSGVAMLRHLHFELGEAAQAPDPCGPTPAFDRVYDPALLGF
jgi:murein DD-endopeptidase MepM/ murein hydrolase activator NlpD